MNIRREMQLEGAQAWLTRIVWLVLPILVLFYSGVPEAQRLLTNVFPETARALARVGLSARSYAALVVSLDVFMFTLMAISATLLMLRRSNDRVVVLVSFMLVATGMIYTVPAYEVHGPVWLLAILIAVGEVCQVMFFFVFPDGRFVPRWSWVIGIVLLLWRPLTWGILGVGYLPNYYASGRTGENYGALRQDLLQILIMLVFFAIGIASQIYRYRRISSQTQRQQTKWLLFGILIAFSLAVPYALAVNVFGLLSRPGDAPLFVRTLGRTLRQIGFCLIPISLLFSMLRYQLWEVDRLINRALVYSVLIAVSAGLYFGSVFALQQLFRTVIGVRSELLVIVISTIGIAALFEPLRQFLRMAINRRFFRASYDAQQTTSALTSALQNEVDLDRVKMQLAGAVETTLQPEHMSLWVREDTTTQH